MMKKIMILTMMLFASIIYAGISSANATDKSTIETSDFYTLSVGFPAKINIIEGDSTLIDIKSADPWFNNEIYYEIKDSTLKISAKCKSDQLYELDPDLTRITIVVPHDIKITTSNKNLLMTRNKQENINHIASDETNN